MLHTSVPPSCPARAVTLITGVVYPLVVTGDRPGGVPRPGERQPDRARRQGRRLARSIGQPFADPKYFWGRPSATSPMPYNGAASSGSNHGPTNPALKETVESRIKDLGRTTPVPVDLVTASASGLDPHISPAAAEYQVPRIAKARGMPEERLRGLVQEYTQGRQLGVLGEPRVNVLELNLRARRRGEMSAFLTSFNPILTRQPLQCAHGEDASARHGNAARWSSCCSPASSPSHSPSICSPRF